MERDISTHVVAYRGKVLILTHPEEKKSVNLKVHGFNKNTRSFSIQKEKELHLGIDGSDIQVICFACIVENETGFKQPCMLVQNHCTITKQFSLHFIFLVHDSSLVKVASFNLRYSISSLKCKLSDGPSLVWLDSNCVEFLVWNLRSKSLDHSCHICTKGDLSTSFKLLWSGSIKDRLVAIGTIKTETNKSEWVYIDFEHGVQPSERILPNVYSHIALCCHVTNVLSSDADNIADQMIYVGTSMAQLIGFAKGRLVSHCKLPFEDPCHILSMEAEDQSSMHVVVKSKKSKVCAINCIEGKVVHEWSHKLFILIDDFLEKGTDQLCLLQGSLTDTLQNFILTNMSGICITPEQESQGQNEILAPDNQNLESVHKTIQALRARLQANAAFLTERKMECDEKKEIIDATCNTLHRMTLLSPQTTAAPRTNIKHLNCLCLISGQNAAEGEGIQYSKPSDVSPTCRVLAIWQRVLADKWTIGVELENNGRSIMTDISLSLMSVKGGNIKSCSRALYYTNNPRLTELLPGDHEESFQNHCISEPECNKKNYVSTPKRRKIDNKNNELDNKSELKPGEKTCVVTVTDLPAFQRGPKYSCSLLLSWTRHHDDEVPSRTVMSCGYVHLLVDQLDELGISNTTRTQDITSKRRHVMAVRAVSTETRFLLTSTVSPLFNAVHLIRQGIHLPENVVGDVTSLDFEDCLLHAYDVNGSLEGVAVLIRPGYKQAQVQLYTRCSSQIYIIVHRLRYALPDDVTIDVNHDAQNKAEEQILERVQRDLTNVMGKLQDERSLSNRVSEMDENPDESASNCTDVNDAKLRKIRIDYERKRKL